MSGSEDLARRIAVLADDKGATEAEAREAAVTWLRGQIPALRQEIAKSGESEKDSGAS